MWRWKTLVILVAFHKFTSSQPVTDDIKNDRPTRQLDFRECCPCEDHDKIDFEDPVAAGTEGLFSRARDGSDCPCLRDADSDGASSLFFPTAMRATGSFLKPGDNKEDLKPLFNPEVDLASSVLQTLREVTDQEYEDALARDAAKSAMRAVEDIMFGDATPQESANVVTIVVPNPNIEDEDDVVPEASHIKQSRCIHPLTSARSNLGKMRIASKPSLTMYNPRLLKPKPALWHRNLYDMDSSVGASNVHENIVRADSNEPQTAIKSLSGISRNVKSDPINDDTNDSCNLDNVSDLKTVSQKNKINLGLNKYPLLQSIREKLRLRNLLPETTIDNDDLRPASSIVQEQATKSFRNNLPLDSFNQNTRPLSLPNLLNLKDVELIPLKELISKPKTPQLDKNEAENGQDFFRNSLIEYNLGDTEESPSSVNEQVVSNDDNDTINNSDAEADLKNTNFKENKVMRPSTEILDTVPVSKNDIAKVLPQSDDTSCMDSMTDASSAIKNVVGDSDPKSLENESKSAEETFEEKIPTDKPKMIEKAKLKLLDPVSVNKTLTTIKENISKKLDDLKLITKNLKNKNMLTQDTNNNNIVNQDLVTRKEQEDLQNETSEISPKDLKIESDLPIENSIFITPEDSVANNELSDNKVDASECSPTKISLQDLQELSDSMLQQELHASKGMEVITEPSEEFTSTANQADFHNFANTVNQKEITRDANSNNFANTQVVSVVEPNMDKFQDKSNEEDACITDLKLNIIDTNSAPSEIVTNTVSKSSNSLGSNTVLKPSMNMLKKPLLDIGDILKLPPLEPLPDIDNLKDKLTDIFDKSEKSAEEVIPFETVDTLNPVMASDASTTNFQLRTPPSKLLEDANFDILGLKPRPGILSNIAKSPLKSKDLSIQSINLQSALDDTRDLFNSGMFKNNRNANFRNSKISASNAYNVMNTPKLNVFKERLLDSPVEATNNIHTTLKNTHNAIESGIRHITNNNKLKNPIIGSHSLLDTLSINHDDINDKLRALHVDFNDRLESVRNDLIDRSKLLSSGIRNTKPNFKSSNNISKQSHRKEASSRRKSQKVSPHRKLTQQKPVKNNVLPKSIKQNNFRMHGASSVPVPKTVQLPELKATSAKSPPLTLQKGYGITPKLSKPFTKEILDGTERQASVIPNSDNQFRNKFLPKKDSIIKVTFSTTPRPFMLTRNNIKSSSPNSGKNRLYDDHNGSPSEVTLSKIPAPIADKYAHLELVDELPRRGSSAIESNRNAPGMVKHRGKSALQSWPRASESGFLSKVREAVQMRLSKVKSPSMLKQASLEIDDDNKEIKTSDMARSATENKEIIDRSPMKQNVSYKCKMVCTKE